MDEGDWFGPPIHPGGASSRLQLTQSQRQYNASTWNTTTYDENNELDGTVINDHDNTMISAAKIEGSIHPPGTKGTNVKGKRSRGMRVSQKVMPRFEEYDPSEIGYRNYEIACEKLGFKPKTSYFTLDNVKFEADSFFQDGYFMPATFSSQDQPQFKVEDISGDDIDERRRQSRPSDYRHGNHAKRKNAGKLGGGQEMDRRLKTNEEQHSAERKKRKTGGDHNPRESRSKTRTPATPGSSHERKIGRSKMSSNVSEAVSSVSPGPQMDMYDSPERDFPQVDEYDHQTPSTGGLGRYGLAENDFEQNGFGRYEAYIKPDNTPPTPMGMRSRMYGDPERVDITELVGYEPGLKLRTTEEYKQLVDARVRGLLSDVRGDGEDFPMDEAMKRRWVGMLYNSIMNVDGIVDKSIKNGKPAQSAARLANGWYPRIEIEKVCWKIVLGLLDSQYNLPLVELHHGTKWEDKATHGDFEARMRKILAVCYTSKALCKQLLDPPYWKRLVDAPQHELLVKLANKKLNDTRDMHNALGRKALQKGIEILDMSDFETPVTPTPSKRSTNRSRHATSSTPASKRGVASSSPVPPRKRKQSRPTLSRIQKDTVADENGSAMSDSEDDKPLAKKKRSNGVAQSFQGKTHPVALTHDAPLDVDDDLPTAGLNNAHSEIGRNRPIRPSSRDLGRSQISAMNVGMADPFTDDSLANLQALTTKAQLAAITASRTSPTDSSSQTKSTLSTQDSSHPTPRTSTSSSPTASKATAIPTSRPVQALPPAPN